MFKNAIITIIASSLLFLLWWRFFDVTWTSESSHDIWGSIIIEVFLFQLLLHFYNQQQDRKMQKHLADHLDKIEAILKKAYASIKDKR